MPRARKPGSGGERQGLPGQNYPLRSDLNMDHAPEGMSGSGLRTAAAGSMQPPPIGQDGMYPEDTPMLGGPTRRPDEPITAGLNPAGVAPPVDEDMRIVLSALPELKIGTQFEDTPASFKAVIYYLENLR